MDLTGDLADIGRGAIDGNADAAVFALVAVTRPTPVDGRDFIAVIVVILGFRPLCSALKSDELSDDDMEAGWSRWKGRTSGFSWNETLFLAESDESEFLRLKEVTVLAL